MTGSSRGRVGTVEGIKDGGWRWWVAVAVGTGDGGAVKARGDGGRWNGVAGRWSAGVVGRLSAVGCGSLVPPVVDMGWYPVDAAAAEEVTVVALAGEMIAVRVCSAAQAVQWNGWLTASPKQARWNGFRQVTQSTYSSPVRWQSGTEQCWPRTSTMLLGGWNAGGAAVDGQTV